MGDVFARLMRLEKLVVIFLIVVVAIMLLIWLIFQFVKFHNRAVFQSIMLENSLRVEKEKDTDKLVDHVNKCIKRSTVEFTNNKKSIVLHIPTKRLIELSTQLNVKKKIKEYLVSEDFREILDSNFPDYRFASSPKYYGKKFL